MKLTKKQLDLAKGVCFIHIDFNDKYGNAIGQWILLKHPIKDNPFYKILKEYLIELEKNEKRKRLYNKQYNKQVEALR